jgi:hypothetical protein
MFLAEPIADEARRIGDAVGTSCGMCNGQRHFHLASIIRATSDERPPGLQVASLKR